METLTKTKGYRVTFDGNVEECNVITENGRPVLYNYSEDYWIPTNERFFLTKQEAESYVASTFPSADEIIKVLSYISNNTWNEKRLKKLLSEEQISLYRHFFIRDMDSIDMSVLDSYYHDFQTAFKGFLTIGNESIRISDIEHIESVQNFDEKEPTIIYLKNGKKIEVTERVQKFILAYIFS